MRFRWRPRRSVLSSHDAVPLRRASLRARAIQGVLAFAAVAMLAAAAASASNLKTREGGLLPSGAVGVVVVDLSLSIADEDMNAVRSAFRRLIDENAPIGLVVFSDVAYELLPPGTPASEMRPMLRLLIPPELGPPINPWTQAFRAGTRVSTALELARQMLERDRVEDGAILLVSDLETAPDDVPSLAKTIDGIRRSDIDLRVYALAPSSDARVMFEGLLQQGSFAPPASSDESDLAPVQARSGAPVAFLVLGALLFAALALHERFGGRLGLPRPERAS